MHQRGGAELDDGQDRALAIYLMQFGGWSECEQVAIFDEAGTLDYVDHQLWPRENADDDHASQAMMSLGYKSSMLTSYFRTLTMSNGEITRLIPNIDPEAMAVPLRKDFNRGPLKLWQCTMLPRHLDHKAYLARLDNVAE